jgi:SOS-response transcriptional repressor LexA
LIGEVAAGVWREANADAFEPVAINVAHDGRFPTASMFALRVRGASINRQAPDGSLVLCLDVFAAPRSPIDGDWVIARRTRNGFAEQTVKRFRIGEDGKQFLEPDSTDPNHQDAIEVGSHDGDSVEITAFVIDFIRPATRL